VTAALAFLGLIGLLLIPSAGGAATVRPPRIPRVTTTTIALADPALVDDGTTQDVAAQDASPQSVLAAATLPGFTFPAFTFGGITFPGFTLPAITLPDFPGSDGFFTSIQSLLNSVFHSLCALFGGFCASA
jgi:hypothetical protein